MARIRRSAVATVAAGAAFAIAAVPTVLAADHAVDIAGFAFSPETVTVSIGDSVTWSNADAQNHTATADDGSFDTGTVSSGTPKSLTFSTAGTFAYHCKIHPQMTGTVVVQGATGTAPTTDTAAPAPATSESSPGLTWIALIAAGLGGLGIARWRFARVSAAR